MRITTLLAAGTLVAGVSAPAAAQLSLIPLDIRVPIAPTPVTENGLVRLTYELRITNIGPGVRALSGLEIFGDQGTTPLQTLDADEIKRSARLAGAPDPQGDSRTLGSGRQTLLYLFVTVPSGSAVPSSLRHRLVVSPPDSATAARRDTLDGYRVSVRAVEPPVLTAPFSGGPWVAVNGPGNTSGHRRTAIPLGGEARIAQRFATDWIKLGPDGAAFHGDSLVNANWYGYGTTVVAVADGVVSEVKDGIIENVPFSPKMAVPITLETVGGNHVNLDLGGGRYAFYAHLQPGSIKVKLGQRVRRGDVIGLLGNSGNSTAPHLHFHVTDGNSPLGAEGIPFVFERFQQFDSLSTQEALLGKWKEPAGGGVAKRRELPLEDAVVRFP